MALATATDREVCMPVVDAKEAGAGTGVLIRNTVPFVEGRGIRSDCRRIARIVWWEGGGAGNRRKCHKMEEHLCRIVRIYIYIYSGKKNSIS